MTATSPCPHCNALLAAKVDGEKIALAVVERPERQGLTKLAKQVMKNERKRYGETCKKQARYASGFRDA